MKIYRIKSLDKFYKNQDNWSDNEDNGQLYTNLTKTTKLILDHQRRWESRPINNNRPWEQESREMWSNAKVVIYDLVPSI